MQEMLSDTIRRDEAALPPCGSADAVNQLPGPDPPTHLIHVNRFDGNRVSWHRETSEIIAEG